MRGNDPDLAVQAEVSALVRGHDPRVAGTTCPERSVGWCPRAYQRSRFARRMRAIRADKGAQLRLLDLQTVDTTLARLDHRRKTLPEHAAIAKLRTVGAAVASDLVAAETRISDLELEQAKP